MDQQEFSGRERRTIDFIRNIGIDDHCHDLQHDHEQEHIRREHTTRHHTQLGIDQYIRHQCRKHLGKYDLCIFHITQTHSTVGHGEKDQDHTVDTVLQQETAVPDLLQRIYQLELEVELPHVCKQGNFQEQADRRQSYIDQALEGFPPAQSVHIIITVCIQHKLLLYSALHRTYCPEAEMPGAARHRHSLCLTIQIPDPAQSFYLVGRQGFPRSPIFYQIFIQTTSYSTPAQYSPP